MYFLFILDWRRVQDINAVDSVAPGWPLSLQFDFPIIITIISVLAIIGNPVQTSPLAVKGKKIPLSVCGFLCSALWWQFCSLDSSSFFFPQPSLARF